MPTLKFLGMAAELAFEFCSRNRIIGDLFWFSFVALITLMWLRLSDRINEKIKKQIEKYDKENEERRW